jgi:hypothetical protein
MKLLDAIFNPDNGGVFATVQAGTGFIYLREEDLEPILKFVKGLRYNDFDGRKVSVYLRKLVRNKELFGLRFGREYSPVMYLTVPNEIAKRVIGELSGGVKAKETDIAGYYGETRTVIRAWWD